MGRLTNHRHVQEYPENELDSALLFGINRHIVVPIFCCLTVGRWEAVEQGLGPLAYGPGIANSMLPTQ